MNILPRLMFLFQVIPIQLSKKFFTQLDQKTAKFIWQSKKPRIKRKWIQDSVDRGGLGLPNFELYYRACSLLWIRDWINLRNSRNLILEGHDLINGWHFYIWYNIEKKNSLFKGHWMRRSLLKVWSQIKLKYYNRTPKWLTPINAFKLQNLINWEQITTYNELLKEDGTLKSSQELKLELINLTWWDRIQLETQFNKDKKNKFYLKPTQLDVLLTQTDAKLIKKFYNLLLSQEMEQEVVKPTMIKWAQDFQETIQLEDWEAAWKMNLKSLKSANLKENFYKMIYRWHLTQDRLAKMFPGTNNSCWKCQKNIGMYIHLWWSCKKVRSYWEEIKDIIQEITNLTLDMKPQIFLLNILPKNIDKENKHIIINIITVARIVYASYWKKMELPPISELIDKVYRTVELDILTDIMNEQKRNLKNIWSPFYRWINLRAHDSNLVMEKYNREVVPLFNND